MSGGWAKERVRVMVAMREGSAIVWALGMPKPP